MESKKKQKGEEEDEKKNIVGKKLWLGKGTGVRFQPEKADLRSKETRIISVVILIGF